MPEQSASSSFNFSGASEEAMISYLESKRVTGAGDQITWAEDGYAKHKPARKIPLIKQRDLPAVSQKTIHMINFAEDRVIDCGVSDWMNLTGSEQDSLLESDPILSNAVAVRKPIVEKAKEAIASSRHSPTGMPDPANKAMQDMNKHLREEYQEKASLNPNMPGSMRSWHQNDKNFLPRIDCDPASLTGKAKKYQRYIEEMKGLTNKQLLKDVKVEYTGYVEYTGGGWPTGTTKGRIVYDYVNDLFFFSPSHYAAWNDTDSPWFRVVTSL
jgi:hypothetical protein